MLLELKAEILRLSTENQRLANAYDAAQHAQQRQAVTDGASAIQEIAHEVATRCTVLAVWSHVEMPMTSGFLPKFFNVLLHYFVSDWGKKRFGKAHRQWSQTFQVESPPF